MPIAPLDVLEHYVTQWTRRKGIRRRKEKSQVEKCNWRNRVYAHDALVQVSATSTENGKFKIMLTRSDCFGDDYYRDLPAKNADEISMRHETNDLSAASCHRLSWTEHPSSDRTRRINWRMVATVPSNLISENAAFQSTSSDTPSKMQRILLVAWCTPDTFYATREPNVRIYCNNKGLQWIREFTMSIEKVTFNMYFAWSGRGKHFNDLTSNQEKKSPFLHFETSQNQML